MSIRVGWITALFPERPNWRSVWLRSSPMVTMKYRNVAIWLNRHGFKNELYRQGERYDAVIVIKTFADVVLDEVARLQAAGTRVIFDANVNYYYIWGDYPDPRAKPTPDLQRQAIQITRLADHVIADSAYLRDVVRDFNPRVTWIPDNVLTGLFRPLPRRSQAGRLRLIWSGIAFKSDELSLIQAALAQVEGLELWLVSETRPTVMEALQDTLPVRWFRYHDIRYAWLLGRSDAIISPRNLNNGYNLGHTEYKIALGMGCGLPAIASPQPSYQIAIARGNGGMICHTMAEWVAALIRLRDDVPYRLALGRQAHQTITRYYATSVIAPQIGQVVRDVLKG